MESEMDTWQFESYSTAEVSPPLSPISLNVQPNSPTLYNQQLAYAPFNDKLLDESPLLSSVQQNANLRAIIKSNGGSNIPLEPSFGLGVNWSQEESVDLSNLQLFADIAELEEIEYTPPQSPSAFKIQSSEMTYDLDNIDVNDLASGNSSQLQSEFEAVLKSLPMTMAEEPQDLADIAALIGEDACLSSALTLEIPQVPTIDFSNMALDFGNIGPTSPTESIASSSSSTSSSNGFWIKNAGIVISEQELLVEMEVEDEDSDTQESQPSDDEDEQEMSRADKILDALAAGDPELAQSYIDTSRPKKDVSFIVELEEPEPSTSKKAGNRSERRGRKPAKFGLAKAMDKVQRKKEQNKTAATRYRHKKKMEVAVTLSVEAQEQEKNDKLSKTKEDIQRQILMVKQLLREVVSAKKSAIKRGRR